MSTDIDLLATKVEKHRAKLSEHTTLLEMTEKRAATADQDRQRAAREAERLKQRAKQAKQEARRLAREAKRAQLRLEAGEADHDLVRGRRARTVDASAA
jgi:chromosome segregation ATPase